MFLNGSVGKSRNDGFHQEQRIGFFRTEGYGLKKKTIHDKISAVRLKAHGYALFVQGLDIPVNRPDTDIVFLGNFFSRYKFFGLQQCEDAKYPVNPVHVSNLPLKWY